MKCFRKFLVVLLFVFGNFSQLLAEFSPIQIAQILDRANHEFAYSYNSSVRQNDYLISGDSIFLNPIGTHYLYSYRKDRNTFLRLDNSKFHGANFERFLFLYKGEVYAFGGYGFWNSHSRLIKFDKSVREWELVQTDGVEIPGKPMFMAQHGDSVFIYGYIVRHKKVNREYYLENSYILDLKTLTINEYKNQKILDVSPHLSTMLNAQNSDFEIMANISSIAYIYSKKNHKIYRNLSGPSLFNTPEKRNDSLYHLIDGNYLISVKGGVERSKIDIENYINLYCDEIVDFNNLPQINHGFDLWENNVFKGVISVALVLLVVLLISLYRVYIPKKAGRYYSELAMQPAINYTDIQKYRGEIYNAVEMDVILKISHLPTGIRKIKRAEIINALNENSDLNIERLIDQSEKGSFLYKIN